MTYQEIIDLFAKRFIPLSRLEMKILEHICSNDSATLTKICDELDVTEGNARLLKRRINVKLLHIKAACRIVVQRQDKPNSPHVWAVVDDMGFGI